MTFPAEIFITPEARDKVITRRVLSEASKLSPEVRIRRIDSWKELAGLSKLDPDPVQSAKERLLLVKMPGNRHADIATAVSLLDIFPSLLQATGIEPPAGLEGSAHDWSSKDGVLKRPVFSETFHAQQHRPGGMQPIALAAVEFGGFKMIRDGQAGHTVVYDLAADPDERQPRRVGNADADQTLQRLLSDWWDHVDEKRRGARTRDATQLLDTDQLERLRTLGYI